MEDYIDFFDFCEKLEFKFNPSIKIESKDCFSSDLIKLLSLRNGERNGSNGVFRRTFSGRFIYYKFLNWSDINRISQEINLNPFFDKFVAKDLLHFAMNSTTENNYEYASSFAISKTNEIFKCNFIEYDRFNLVQDIGQVRFSNNLTEFLNTQRQLIAWDFQENYKIR